MSKTQDSLPHKIVKFCSSLTSRADHVRLLYEKKAGRGGAWEREEEEEKGESGKEMKKETKEK